MSDPEHTRPSLGAELMPLGRKYMLPQCFKKKTLYILVFWNFDLTNAIQLIVVLYCPLVSTEETTKQIMEMSPKIDGRTVVKKKVK